MNSVQTELDSPPDLAQHQLADSVFIWFEIVLTSVFTLEVVVNMAANWFWSFITDAWLVRTQPCPSLKPQPIALMPMLLTELAVLHWHA